MLKKIQKKPLLLVLEVKNNWKQNLLSLHPEKASTFLAS